MLVDGEQAKPEGQRYLLDRKAADSTKVGMDIDRVRYVDWFQDLVTPVVDVLLAMRAVKLERLKLLYLKWCTVQNDSACLLSKIETWDVKQVSKVREELRGKLRSDEVTESKVMWQLL
jgi:hypothetical protein